MKRLLVVGSVVLGSIALSGCGLQSGHTMMTYNSLASEAPGMNTVDQPGTYALYPSDGANAITTKHLQQGDQYGFTKDPDGKVVAAVVTNGSQQTIQLTAKLATSYYWKIQ